MTDIFTFGSYVYYQNKHTFNIFPKKNTEYTLWYV